MKKLIIALYCAFAMGSVSATVDGPVSFDFAAVPVQSFMSATYSNLLGRDFVLSPEVLGMDKRISVKVKSVPLAELPAFVDGILAAQGVVSVKRGGVYYVDVLKAPVGLPAGSGGISAGGAGSGVVGGPSLADSGPLLSSEKHEVYRPMNRSVDFMVSVLNGAFGVSVARAAGAVVVLAAPKDRLAAVVALAGQLDLPPHTVEVSASFVEVSRSSSSSRGISLVANVLGAKFGVVMGSGSGDLSIKSSSFELVLDALSADGRFKQVSNIRAVGDESERLSLTVGDETPTLQATGKDNLGNATSSVVYRASGVILDVVPRVLGSGRVAMSVDGQISAFQATLTGVTGSPTLVKRQVKTSVTVRDSEVLIIGGLDDTKTTETKSGFSFLPRSWSAGGGSDIKSDLVLILSAKVLAVK